MSGIRRWAPPTWIFFHTFAAKINKTFFEQNRSACLEIIKLICSCLPCPDCTKHAIHFMRRVNANTVRTKEELIDILQNSETEIFLNFLPVGSEEAVKFYAECCLDSGIAFINCMPVFIASNEKWSKKFKEKNIPIIGDDVKSQIGATITHRVLTNLFKQRGVKLERTYQLNTGGNTDFLNMLNRKRLNSKKISKTEAVQSVLDQSLHPDNIHIGPSDYVPWQKDNKIAFIRMEGRLFGNIPMNLELRLSVEDSPNSAGVVIDAIRCCKLALDRNVGGVLYSPSAYFMKKPPVQMNDEEARKKVEMFIHGKIER